MKNNIIKWMIYLSIILMIGIGCQDQTDVYKEFVVSGGNVYPGVMVNPKVLSGAYRVQIDGLKPMGADVKEIRVFWNYFKDSVSYKLNENTPKNVKIDIAGLKEQSYLFTIRSYNSNGDVSVPLELFGKAYGNKYVATLSNRALIKVAYNPQSAVEFEFDKAIEGTLYSDIFYTNKNQEAISLRVPVNQSKVVIADYNAVKPIQYITAYKPDTTCIDTFYSELSENLKMGYPQLNVIAFSSQNSTAANIRAADFVDGNPATRWHTKVGVAYPHFATIDMVIPRPVTAFEIWTHTTEAATNRACSKFKLEISLDNSTWTNIGEFNFDRFDYTGGQMFYIPGNQVARYFKFTGLVGPTPEMVMGEIYVHSDITADKGKFYGTWESTSGGIKQTLSFKNNYGNYSQNDANALRMNWSVANQKLTIDLIGGAKSYSFSGDGKQLTIEGVGVFDKVK